MICYVMILFRHIEVDVDVPHTFNNFHKERSFRFWLMFDFVTLVRGACSTCFREGTCEIER